MGGCVMSAPVSPAWCTGVMSTVLSSPAGAPGTAALDGSVWVRGWLIGSPVGAEDCTESRPDLLDGGGASGRLNFFSQNISDGEHHTK